jgi:hypothetical protein
MKKISRTGKVAHDLGLSTWFGGTLFGQFSLNPTVSSINAQRERGRVLNEAWARFQAANIPAMLSTLLGWRLGGVRDDSELRAPGLTRAKDVLLGGSGLQYGCFGPPRDDHGVGLSEWSHAGAHGQRTLAQDTARGVARRVALALHRQRISGTAGCYGGGLGADRGGRARTPRPPLAPAIGLAKALAEPA